MIVEAMRYLVCPSVYQYNCYISSLLLPQASIRQVSHRTCHHLFTYTKGQNMTTIARSETSFASTLPGRYYYDPQIYAREQEQIFSQMWVCAGRDDAIAQIGAYQTVQLGNESIIIVRNRDGISQAFLNVCRHRGSRLCTEAQGQLKGSIQCRYHAWTYGLDGQLIGAPNVLNNEQFDRTAFGLVSVALGVWQALIWLNLADNPPSATAQLKPGRSERFGEYASCTRY